MRIWKQGEELYKRRRELAEYVRKAVQTAGFKLYPDPNYDVSTITTSEVPTRVPDADYRLRLLQEHGWQIADRYGPLAGEI